MSCWYRPLPTLIITLSILQSIILRMNEIIQITVWLVLALLPLLFNGHKYFYQCNWTGHLRLTGLLYLGNWKDAVCYAFVSAGTGSHIHIKLLLILSLKLPKTFIQLLSPPHPLKHFFFTFKNRTLYLVLLNFFSSSSF